MDRLYRISGAADSGVDSHAVTVPKKRSELRHCVVTLFDKKNDANTDNISLQTRRRRGFSRERIASTSKSRPKPLLPEMLIFASTQLSADVTNQLAFLAGTTGAQIGEKWGLELD